MLEHGGETPCNGLGCVSVAAALPLVGDRRRVRARAPDIGSAPTGRSPWRPRGGGADRAVHERISSDRLQHGSHLDDDRLDETSPSWVVARAPGAASGWSVEDWLRHEGHSARIRLQQRFGEISAPASWPSAHDSSSVTQRAVSSLDQLEGGSGGSDFLVAPDALVELLGGGGRRRVELLTERSRQVVVLAQRNVAPALARVAAHELAMGVLA